MSSVETLVVWVFIAACVFGLGYYLWTNTGRFKWFTVGMITIMAIRAWDNEYIWLVVGAVLVAIHIRDERVRASRIEEAKEEARKDFLNRPSRLVRDIYEEPELPLEEPHERIMDCLSRRILERL